MKTLSTLAILIGVLGGLAAQPAMAAPNLANGKKIEDTKCYQCHAEKSGLGDVTLIYTRKDRRVKGLDRLKVMVARCNTELRLDLFPEDEADVVAYLNQQYYKFKP
ncbi:MAG: hypothetical protein RLZZ365_469 [Pseudomonadota bacterium]|jgi:hypothetical protein